MSWRQEYLENLRRRDELEKANYDLIDAYSRLADQTAALEAKVSTNSYSTITTTPGNYAPSLSNQEEAAQVKGDLAEALRAKGQLQRRLKVTEETLERLKTRAKADSSLIRDISAERAQLILKVKDRDEELRGKTLLLVQVQDENMSLDLQLNMAEQQTARLRRENKDLIDRWMARMGQEADAMNEASKF
ncbi:autophagy protein 16, interacts with Atg12p-Atg5p [Pseudogymnoascus australis]